MPVLLTNLVATLFLTGVGWSLQLVQLPLLHPDQLGQHRHLNSRLIALPMSVEFIAAASLVIQQSHAAQIAAFLLWLPVGYATLRYSMLHAKSPDRDGLKRWNLVRTACWTARSAILIYLAGALSSQGNR